MHAGPAVRSRELMGVKHAGWCTRVGARGLAQTGEAHGACGRGVVYVGCG